MEGVSYSPVVDPASTQHEYSWRVKAGAMVAAVGASAALMAGCSTSHNKAKPTGPAVVEASPTTTAAAETACGGPINLEANRADTAFGSNTSEFPSLQTKPDANGKQELMSAADAASTLKEQLRSDSRVLAVFTAFFMNTRKTEQLPDTGTLGQAKQLMDSTYKTNKDLAGQDLIKACAAIQPDFLVPTKAFAVTRGQYMDVVAEHNSNTKTVTGFKTVKGNATQNLEGYMLSYNKDDASLTDEQKSIFDKLSQLILITKDGNIVINLTFGESAFTVEQDHTPTSVTVSPSASNSVTFSASPSPSKEQQQNQNNNNAGSGGNTGSTGGTNGTNNGSGVNQGPKPEKNSGPAGGNQPGNGGAPEGTPTSKETTPAGGGSTPTPSETPTPSHTPKPTPTPSPSTPPETTPPSTPPETTPPSTPPETTPPSTPPPTPSKSPAPPTNPN